ncbi:hypothetical protein [Lederbergia lenta]|uniref:Uncharacterized protein n=1 Tax=Lederbergia lenta TaxID=1467 RepID=A0A2X4W5G4_LEDLE|nr:hypothetical protein [Lederbergia lenta]MCM3111009.1 hypothetical protein [Lederbergia lenta]MEC2325603.1 hypothetical protein [Lederbergia lenta]SQI54182.1 Uncharacterised protein [Lederbergia lenta]
MQLGVLLGLAAVLGAIAVFLVYFIGSALNSNDSSTIDELPEKNFNHNAK